MSIRYSKFYERTVVVCFNWTQRSHVVLLSSDWISITVRIGIMKSSGKFQFVMIHIGTNDSSHGTTPNTEDFRDLGRELKKRKIQVILFEIISVAGV